MDQYYQPLSHALNPPLAQPGRSPQHQYPANPYAAAPNGSTHREEEEEEEEDDEDIVEEELEHNEPDNHHPSHQSSPRTSAAQPNAGTTLTGPVSNVANPKPATQDQHQQQSVDVDGTEKRKPGRPRGSRNRKPRAPPGSSTKAPANTQHPGFYHYPPVPGGAIPQNQQFYEFQWRALNLCSEFYNAAEELVKAASPLVIAQCYQMGPATKVDPLAMISEAKRVCDSLLANPSQLVGSPPPAVYASPYPPMIPPAPGASTAASSAAPAVITNPQSFVMSLGTSAMPPPSHPTPHSQPFYPPMYASPNSRYPTAPYYSYQPQPPPYGYAAPPQASQASPAPAPPTSASTGTISTFNAATGSAAPGGQQGTWSEEETDRLRKLAEQSREMGGPQNKGEIEWDWVVQQWGNSRTRHQILLKATSMGLKESTTRGTKRRRDTESVARDSGESTAHPTPAPAVAQAPTPAAPPVATTAVSAVAASPTQSPSTPATANPPAASTTTGHPPSGQAARPASSTSSTVVPARTTTAASTPNMPWPMPTVAANTPSPVLATAQTESQRTNSYYAKARPTQTTSYGAAAAGSNPPASRPTSSHGSNTTHHYMYRPNGSASGDRR